MNEEKLIKLYQLSEKIIVLIEENLDVYSCNITSEFEGVLSDMMYQIEGLIKKAN